MILKIDIRAIIGCLMIWCSLSGCTRTEHAAQPAEWPIDVHISWLYDEADSEGYELYAVDDTLCFRTISAIMFGTKLSYTQLLSQEQKNDIRAILGDSTTQIYRVRNIDALSFGDLKERLCVNLCSDSLCGNDTIADKLYTYMMSISPLWPILTDNEDSYTWPGPGEPNPEYSYYSPYDWTEIKLMMCTSGCLQVRMDQLITVNRDSIVYENKTPTSRQARPLSVEEIAHIDDLISHININGRYYYYTRMAGGESISINVDGHEVCMLSPFETRFLGVDNMYRKLYYYLMDLSPRYPYIYAG